MPIAYGHPFLTIQRAVHRLTAEVADWFALKPEPCVRVSAPTSSSSTRPGLTHRSTAITRKEVPFYGGLSRMVNRNDGAIVATGVNGIVVYRNGQFCEGYGTTVKSGRFLRAGAGQLAKTPV